MKGSNYCKVIKALLSTLEIQGYIFNPISFKRDSLCATTHFGYTFLHLWSLTPRGKDPPWDINNPLSKKIFIIKKCQILRILWNFPKQPKSHPISIFGKKHAFFMKIFGQNLKTIQKHPKEGPETQKKIFFMLSPFLRVFVQKDEFRPVVWWRVARLDFFLSLNLLSHNL